MENLALRKASKWACLALFYLAVISTFHLKVPNLIRKDGNRMALNFDGKVCFVYVVQYLYYDS